MVGRGDEGGGESDGSETGIRAGDGAGAVEDDAGEVVWSGSTEFVTPSGDLGDLEGLEGLVVDLAGWAGWLADLDAALGIFAFLSSCFAFGEAEQAGTRL